ncbi:MAG: histidine--tRNA ligase [Calditrichales bacterium]|nr:MAG: histidine--tRNA ligase [Calditrichales bacterium]
MSLRRIKGTQDILPEFSARWQFVESVIQRCMRVFNYKEIRTPVFEQTEVFARGIGQLTDIVSKEMYTFKDKGEKSLTLKPEMTAPVMRAFLENKMGNQLPLNKLYYLSPLFRQENPQAGRLRQFNQFGAEAIGPCSAELDAEVIILAMFIYNELGIKNLNLKLNSVGDPASRERYKTELKHYFKPLLDQYCDDCKNRYESNPMRVLDCKKRDCKVLNKKAPKLLDYLDERSMGHLEKVKQILTDNGTDFEVDPYLVRGLDYYTDTVFEITSGNLGSQDAICGGGRYDLLAEQLDGAHTPAVGFASGIERLLMVMEAQELLKLEDASLDVYLCVLGDSASNPAMQWLQRIRDLGLSADRDYLGRSVKAQMRDANRQKAQIVLLLGENELDEKKFAVKDMVAGTQTDVGFDQIISFLNAYFKRQE